MIGIDRQLRKYFIVVIVIAVLIIFVVSNLGMAYFFHNYVQQTQIKSDLKIVQYIETGYQQDAQSLGNMSGLMPLIRGEEAEVKLFDIQGRIMWDTTNMGNRGMGRGWGMMQHGAGMSAADLVFRQYPLSVEGQSIGTVEIGRKESMVASAQDKNFVVAMNMVFAAALLFSILLAWYMSKFAAGKFLQPLLTVKKNIESIAVKSENKIAPVTSFTKEIQELAEATQELANSLQEQEKLRKRLTSDIAHELRTPLATLQSHLEAMIDGIWEPNPQRLSHCNDEVIRLTRLISELDQITAIESDIISLNKSQINLSELLTEIAENYRVVMREKMIDLQKDIDANIEIQADSDRIKQILVNLLSNAYKYTAANGQVQVSLRAQGSMAVITIKDNGPGIKAEDLPHVFERFYRGDLSRSRKTGGTGIGLTIAKALTEAHQGKLQIVSEYGKGVQVEVQLPVC